MALTVTFGRHIDEPGAPIMDGSKSRSFMLDVPDQSDGDTVSAFSAGAGENVVMLVSSVDCWVDIGPGPVAQVPDATSGIRGFRIPAGVPIYLAVEQGEKVAVIAG